MNKRARQKKTGGNGLKFAAGTLGALVLVCCALVGAQTVVASEAPQALLAQVGESDNDTLKSEVVYGKLASDGSMQNVYVVNTLEPETAGTLEDYGSYQAVQNLTNASALGFSDGVVTVDIAEGDEGAPFSYQGDLGQAAVPWNVRVTYQLDGESVSAEQLAGATGSLKLSLEISQNTACDSAFFENYLVTVSMVFDSDKARNVVAKDAQVALSGADTQLTFMSMPGKENTFVATADVQDFAFDGIQVAAIPFAIALDFPDTNDLIAQFTQLTSAAAALDSGAAALSEGAQELAGGLGQLAGGGTDLTQGLSGVAAGTSGVAQGVSGLATGASGVAQGLLAYQQGLAGQAAQAEAASDALGSEADVQNAYTEAFQAYLSAYSEAYAQAFAQQYAVAYAGAIAGGASEQEAAQTAAQAAAQPAAEAAVQAAAAQLPALQQAQAALAQKAGYAGSSQALSGAAAGLGTSDDPQSLLGGAMELADGAAQAAGAADQLASGAGQLVSGAQAYTDAVDGAAQGAQEYAEGSAEFAQGVTTFASETHGLPQAVQSQIDDMISQYDKSSFVPRSFVSSHNTNVKLVQFVLSTEAIVAPEPAEEPELAPEQSFLDRFFALFK